jgi:hypothetical protein
MTKSAGLAMAHVLSQIISLPSGQRTRPGRDAR